MGKKEFRNGIRHSAKLHEHAKILRQQGFTHREIVKRLGISLGSADLWTRGITVTAEQKRAIQERARVAVGIAFTKERRARQGKWAREHIAPKEKYTKDDLLQKIRTFYKVNGRIPLKREFNMYHEYKRRFGSWNTAIRLAGFTTNPQLFAYKFVAKDGHRCDSFTEKIIDDWLYYNSIGHQRHVPYPGTKMTADFVLGKNTILEFFGLAGVQKQYDVLVERKRRISKERGIQLIEVYPKDLFPKNRLADIIAR